MLALLLVIAGCDPLFELISPKRTDRDDIEEKLKGEASYFRAMTEIEFVDEKGTHHYPARVFPYWDPDRPEGLTRLIDQMEQLYHVGDEPGAIEAARAVLAVDEDNTQALTTLVLSYARRGEHLLLLPELKQKALAEPPSAAHLLALGRLQIELGDAEQGKVYLDRAAGLEPDLPLLHHNLGRYYGNFARQLDVGRALQEYQREIELTRFSASYFNLVQWYDKDIGDGQAAVKVLDRYFAHYAGGFEECSCLIQVVIRAGMNERARKVDIPRCLEATGHHLDKRHDIGILLIGMLEWESAAEYYQKMIDDLGGRAGPGLGYRMHFHLGMALEALCRGEEAEAHFAKSLRYNPDWGGSYFYRGLARLQQGNNRGALQDFREAWRRKPDSENARFWVKKLEAEPGIAFTREDFDKIHNIYPKYSDADRLASAGFGYMRHRVWDRAEEKYAAALKLDPGNGHAWMGKADLVRLRDQDFNRTIDIGKQGLLAGADTADLHNVIGYAYRRLGDNETALKYFRQALARSPRFRVAHVNAARALEDLGRGEEAMPHWEAIGIDLDVWDPLGPYKPFAYGAVALLAVLFVVMRIRRARASRTKPGADVTSARR